VAKPNALLDSLEGEEAPLEKSKELVVEKVNTSLEAVVLVPKLKEVVVSAGGVLVGILDPKPKEVVVLKPDPKGADVLLDPKLKEAAV